MILIENDEKKKKQFAELRMSMAKEKFHIETRPVLKFRKVEQSSACLL